MSEMNILITGSLSHLATNFINLYAKEFNKVVLIDSISYCSNSENLSIFDKKYTYIYKDINSLNIEYTLNKYNIDVILHCAASTHVDRSYTHFQEFVDNNIIGTINLLEGIKNYNKIKKVIYISTDEIYGGSNDKIFKEDSSFNPTNPYSASKASAEMIVNSYIYSYKLPITIIRPNNLYGPYQYPEKAIPKFINQILNNEPVTIHGDGNHIRDFLYTPELCRCILFLIQNDIQSPDHIFNIGVDNPININDLVKYIYNRIKSKNLTNLTYDNYKVYIKNRLYNDFRYKLDSSRLQELGFVIQNDWEQHIDNTIDWYINNYKKEIYDNSDKLFYYKCIYVLYLSMLMYYLLNC